MLRGDVEDWLAERDKALRERAEKIATGYTLVGKGSRMGCGCRDYRWSDCVFSRTLTEAMAAFAKSWRRGHVIEKRGRRQ